MNRFDKLILDKICADFERTPKKFHDALRFNVRLVLWSDRKRLQRRFLARMMKAGAN